MADEIKVQIRYLIRRDLPEVLGIDRESFENPWTEEDFLCCLRQRNCLGIVAEHDHEIVGYMIYEPYKNRYRILNFAVDPERRFCSIGRQMVFRMIGRLSPDIRTKITLEIRESNLDAQLFFKSMGFQCVSIMNGYYENSDESGYIFEYNLLKLTDEQFDELFHGAV